MGESPQNHCQFLWNINLLLNKLVTEKSPVWDDSSTGDLYFPGV